jgi:hypothetical protein
MTVAFPQTQMHMHRALALPLQMRLLRWPPYRMLLGYSGDTFDGWQPWQQLWN